MRTAEAFSELHGAVIIQDANGLVAQRIEHRIVRMYEHQTGREWNHTIEEGWWNLNMTVPVDPQMICFPVSVVWER